MDEKHIYVYISTNTCNMHKCILPGPGRIRLASAQNRFLGTIPRRRASRTTRRRTSAVALVASSDRGFAAPTCTKREARTKLNENKNCFYKPVCLK